MALGGNFPVGDYYKDQILDAETISRGGGWWSAILLIRDPKTEQPFMAIYRWQFDGETWKMRKTISFKNKKQVEAAIQAMSRFKDRMIGGKV